MSDIENDINIDANYIKIKEKAEVFYKTVSEVYCPYFKEKVAFNDKGIKHIKFKSERVARDRKDQYMRLKNIHLAPLVLKSSYTLQEIQTKKMFIDIDTNTRHEKMLKEVTYYAFIAILKDGQFDKRVKVIVKQVSGGIKMFWSIIPFWKSNKELKLHTGDLEND
ncbi:hypothetical protein IPF86_01435 [Candidatus Nomurabacteria bacterium]|nr:MAG: hypothetical protein IPF86_01435 [Candidatus Nomurabacteria bacterium]